VQHDYLTAEAQRAQRKTKENSLQESRKFMKSKSKKFLLLFIYACIPVLPAFLKSIFLLTFSPRSPRLCGE
jgi:hypothetical protein